MNAPFAVTETRFTDEIGRKWANLFVHINTAGGWCSGMNAICRKDSPHWRPFTGIGNIYVLNPDARNPKNRKVEQY